jgi:hypothetical protein
LIAATSDVGGSVYADLFEYATVAAGFVLDVFLVHLDLGREKGTDCFSLNLSMRIYMSLR